MIDSNKFTIGDITISVEGDFQLNALEIPPAYRPFIKKGKRHITLRLHEKAPVPTVGEKMFESPGISSSINWSSLLYFSISDGWS